MITGLGRFLEVGIGNPLQYACLENSMDRGAQRAPEQGVAKSQTRLSTSSTKKMHTYTIRNQGYRHHVLMLYKQYFIFNMAFSNSLQLVCTLMSL